MSFGAKKDSASSSSTSQSQNESFGSNVWGPQQGYLTGQYQDANAIYQQQAGNPMGMRGYEQNQAALQASGNALSDRYMQGAQNTFERLQNPGMDPMMGVYARQVGQNFNEQVMPALQGESIMAGGMGNSRAQIGQGLAAARAGQQLQDFGAQLYSDNQNRALQAAQLGSGLQGSIAGAYGQLGQGYMQNAQFGMAVPWYAAQQRAGLLGNPIMQDLGSRGASGSQAGSKSSSVAANAGLW